MCIGPMISKDFPWTNTGFDFDSFYIAEEQLKMGDKRLLEVDSFVVLPINAEGRLLITSRDVLHSFTIPSLGIKTDSVPGRLNQVPLIIKVPGTYFGQCSELCGPSHGFMPIVIQSQTI